MTEQADEGQLRKCSSCLLVKPKIDFFARHRVIHPVRGPEYTRPEYRGYCLSCKHAKDRQYGNDHAKVRRERSRCWYYANLKYASDYSKIYRAANKEHLRQYYDNWRLVNGDGYREQQRQNPQYAMTNRLRARMNRIFQRAMVKKSISTMTFVGCTGAEFVRHIERQFVKGMTWENRNLWHIDHIRPCDQFDMNDLEQQRACFHFTNLRPLWRQLNQAKGAQRVFLI
jgi:hypothetical protein